MAGGPSTVELVVASARAGALGFLAGGYKTVAGLAEEMEGVRSAGVEVFGVNLFVPGDPTADEEGLVAYLAELEAEATALGTSLGEARWNDDDYAGKLDAVLAAPPPAVSFTFGVPSGAVVRALQAAGSAVLVTATTPEEAKEALRVAPDALCLQGAEAGAHRGSLVNEDRADQDRPDPRPARRGAPADARAPGGRGRGQRARRRGRPRGPWRRPGPGGHGLPALPRERRVRRRRRMRWPTPPSRAPRSRGRSVAAGPAPWSTPWCGSTRPLRPPTPRSTTPRGPCVPRRPGRVTRNT